jgi:biopolymer transport protein ExbB/TolQ
MENLLTLGERIIFTVMGLASVLALAVGIERALLFRHTTRSGEIIVPELVAQLRAKDIAGISGYIDGYLIQFPESVYARFAAFIKEHYAKGPAVIAHLMEGKIIEERLFLERRITILASLGNNAPFIGLLGTVFGIIKAFYNLGTLGNTGAEVVMRSISSALLATAGGLLIAIPVVIANNFFMRRVKTTMQQIEVISKETLASLEPDSSQR